MYLCTLKSGGGMGFSPIRDCKGIGDFFRITVRNEDVFFALERLEIYVQGYCFFKKKNTFANPFCKI
jgi:hypothetical protein